MQGLLSITRRSVLPILLGAAALAACGGHGRRTCRHPRIGAVGHVHHQRPGGAGGHGGWRDQRRRGQHARPGERAQARSAPDEARAPDERRFVCPEGGIDDVVAVQDAFDEGHQPWRGSAPDVAAVCTFGMPDTSVEPMGENRYRVTQLSSGDRVVVEVAQPLGPDGIWVVTSVTASPPAPAPTPAAASCDAEAILPVVRQALEQDGFRIAAVAVRQCQNGYARVSARTGQLDVWPAHRTVRRQRTGLPDRLRRGLDLPDVRHRHQLRNRR